MCYTTKMMGFGIGEVGPGNWGDSGVVRMSLMGYCYMKCKYI